MVSIIMSTFDRAYIIDRAIRSVINQTYEDWELIVVDDASKDNTEEVVKKYTIPKIRYYRNQRNLGANTSRNIGAAHAKGDMLAFLDSDNYWPKDRLEWQMELMERNREKRCFLYGKASVVDGGETRIFPDSIYSHMELKAREMLGNVLDLNTIMLKKEIFEEAGAFDEELARFQDWELILRLMYSFGVEAIGCDQILSYNEIQENSIGRSASYIEACGKILKKHMCSRLPEKDMLDYLLGIWSADGEDKKSAMKTIGEIGDADVRLLPEAVRLLAELQEVLARQRDKFRVSHGMEELIYEWHEKNLVSPKGTLFSRYFYDGSVITKIAVYGYGKLGSLFLSEIIKLPVDVAYIIDKKAESFEGMVVKRPGDRLEQVDLIVVAVLDKAEEIRDSLSKMYHGDIVTLAELIKRDKEDGKKG